MAGRMGHFAYVSDDGTTSRIRLDASNALAVGAASAATGTPKAAGLVCRYVLAEHPTTLRERRIVVTDPASPVWTGATTTLSLIDYDTNLPETFNLRGRIGEKRTARG